MANMGEALSEDEVQVTTRYPTKNKQKRFNNFKLKAMIEEADTDGDGSINYAEFFVMVSKSLA